MADSRITERFDQLLRQADHIEEGRVSSDWVDENGNIVYSVDEEISTEWITSVRNLISQVVGPDSDYHASLQTFEVGGLSSLRNARGVLRAVRNDYAAGLVANFKEAHTVTPSHVDSRIVFIIHGRDLQARDSLFAFLRSVGLRPLEWSEAVKATAKPSPYVGEILDKAFSVAQAVIVLMTPDDEARLREPFRQHTDPDYEANLTPQARPNVLFEAGMAMGRSPDRTVLVELGTLRPFSDIAGRHVVRLNNSGPRRQELLSRLEDCGCPVNRDGTAWHTAGDFTVSEITATDKRGIQEPDARQTRQTSEAPCAPEAFVPKKYYACFAPMLHDGGDLVDDAKARSPQVWHVPPDDESSPLLFGPYVQLSPGTYRADFRLRMEGHLVRGRVGCEVAYFKGGSLEVLNREPNVKPPKPGGYVERHLIFEVTEEMKDARFEFRVFQVEPGIELWVDTIIIQQL